MINLSYSSLKLLMGEANHEWLNKQMGVSVPEYPFLAEGREAHRIVQDHVSGVKLDPRLAHITVKFPIVETKDYDEKCKFTISISDKYNVIGYYDGIDVEAGRFLECKFSTKHWSMTQFDKSMQRKIYALANPWLKEGDIITGTKDPEKWVNDPPKFYSTKLTDKDHQEAYDWILEGIKILEKGEFKGGLDETGHCTGCFYNMPRYKHLATCQFI